VICEFVSVVCVCVKCVSVCVVCVLCGYFLGVCVVYL